MNFMQDFIATHDQNKPNAKFKIGQDVMYSHLGAAGLYQGEGKILAIGDTGEGMEYAVAGHPWLLWENEITPLNV